MSPALDAANNIISASPELDTAEQNAESPLVIKRVLQIKKTHTTNYHEAMLNDMHHGSIKAKRTRATEEARAHMT